MAKLLSVRNETYDIVKEIAKKEDRDMSVIIHRAILKYKED